MSVQYINSIILKNPPDKYSYLNKVPAVKHLIENGRLDFENDVTFFVGENGSGKSTLIEAIAAAYGFNPEGGTKNFSFSTKSSHSDLYENVRISRGKLSKDGFFLRAESFYNAATYIDEMGVVGSYGGVSLHEKSHGESFLQLVQNRFEGNGIYLLDEPEAALSPMRLLTLMSEIHRLVKENSQFIIATHSPILLAFPNAEVMEITENGIESVDYTETEHYKVTKLFLENPRRMLDILMPES